MKPANTHISGGYILYSRCFLHMLEEAPLLDRALWTWLNCRANHKDLNSHAGHLARGQLLAGLSEMRDALCHRAGRSVRRPSKAAVYRALERYRRRNMIETRRTTRGLVITICDYERYQNPGNYERHASETVETPIARHDRQQEKNEKKKRGSSSFSHSSLSRTFEQMDRDRAAQALAQVRKEFLADEQA